MSNLYRSEDMSLCQLYIQHESVYQCVAVLGELGIVAFVDANVNTPTSKRLFVTQIKKCDEMERKLRFIEKDIRRSQVTIISESINTDAPTIRETLELENNIDKMYNDFVEVNESTKSLRKSFQELLEIKHVLVKSKKIFLERSSKQIIQVDRQEASLLDNSSDSSHLFSFRLGFVSGVILYDRIIPFERMLWRMCHGIAFLRYIKIEEPLEDFVSEKEVHKCVFMVFFQGNQLKIRVKKICEAFNATIYYCPDNPEEHENMLDAIKTRLMDLLIVIEQTRSHHYWLLNEAAKYIKEYYIKVQKMKYIYFSINLFNNDVTQKCLIGECWCANKDLEKLQKALADGTDKSGSNIPSILNCVSSNDMPPTYNHTNKFTKAFQGLIDAYGISTYKEINPSPFTVITFPFLFAVMFGDWGHGLIMFLFALFLVLYEKKIEAKRIEDEIFTIAFNGRYLILIMGLFSIFTGLIYNDCFSRSAFFQPTTWDAFNVTKEELMDKDTLQLDPSTSFTGPYAFGVDPIWQLAKNKITFLNSYKMKISIIFGVLHMLFGVLLSLFNHLYFKNYISIIGEFIPRLIFLLSIFGYLTFLIVYKWFAFTAKNSGDAPSLLITLINMLMLKGPGKVLYWRQKEVQLFLLVLVGICIPWMLLVKPVYQYCRWRSQRGPSYVALVEESGGTPSEEMKKEFDVAEVATLQTIHTIEYCLGTISHTASYLRLWALSLAHAQLSEVLWSMILRNVFAKTISNNMGGVYLYFIFAPWAVLSVVILVVMEGLSAFLHALRLHWVEFQSKFYEGSGHPFVPFTFYAIEHDVEQLSREAK